MEAMVHKIPVVSTDTGGIPELLSDGSGIMVKEKDPEALANAIMRLMNEKNFYDEMAEKGRLKIARTFNIDFIAERLLTLFLSRTDSPVEQSKLKNI
jgi:glycosyltransferase involved in cell wall biosynthesis